MNNVLIIGRAKASEYTDAILRYSEPERLEIVTPTSNYNDELEISILNLNLGLKILKEGEEQASFESIICFTDRVGLEEVMFLEEAIKEKINVVFINPK